MEATYPVEPWEIRAYVEENPSRIYIPSDPQNCIIGRYCNERLDGEWSQQNDRLASRRDATDILPYVTYPVPRWAFELMEVFDTDFFAGVGVAGKDILEADILPRDDA